MAVDRRQEAESMGQKAQDSRQQAGGEDRITEVIGCRQEAEGRKQETGGKNR